MVVMLESEVRKAKKAKSYGGKSETSEIDNTYYFLEVGKVHL